MRTKKRRRKRMVAKKTWQRLTNSACPWTTSFSLIANLAGAKGNMGSLIANLVGAKENTGSLGKAKQTIRVGRKKTKVLGTIGAMVGGAGATGAVVEVGRSLGTSKMTDLVLTPAMQNPTSQSHTTRNPMTSPMARTMTHMIRTSGATTRAAAGTATAGQRSQALMAVVAAMAKRSSDIARMHATSGVVERKAAAVVTVMAGVVGQAAAISSLPKRLANLGR
mmetsp:Transcript_131832/g.263090  ORF Transcript_131832/g.263090 Transcript_131832/m.263090 type:complete len:222 (+) Transcript_131832:475-1140(+)